MAIFSKRDITMSKNTHSTLMFKLSILGLTSLMTLVVGCSSVTAKTTASNKSGVNNLTTRTPAYKRQWTKTPFGAFVSKVDGNFAKGKHITMVRFPAGLKTTVHTHSHDYVGVVTTGVARHYEPNKKSTMGKLPAGSHWKIPANVPHISECFEGSGECIMTIYQDANFDFLPVK